MYVPLVHLLFFIVILCIMFSCRHQLLTPDEYRGFDRLVNKALFSRSKIYSFFFLIGT